MFIKVFVHIPPTCASKKTVVLLQRIVDSCVDQVRHWMLRDAHILHANVAPMWCRLQIDHSQTRAGPARVVDIQTDHSQSAWVYAFAQTTSSLRWCSNFSTRSEQSTDEKFVCKLSPCAARLVAQETRTFSFKDGSSQHQNEQTFSSTNDESHGEQLSQVWPKTRDLTHDKWRPWGCSPSHPLSA